MNLLILTYYNFNTELTGSTNRVLEMIKRLPPEVKTTIVHKGKDFQSHEIEFIGYDTKLQLGPYLIILSSDLRRKLNSLRKEYDIIQIESPYMFLPVYFIRKSLKKKTKIVLDEHNVESLCSATFLKNWKTVVHVLFLLPIQFLFEILSTHIVNHIITVSEKDKNSLSKLYHVSKNKISVIPNGVSKNNNLTGEELATSSCEAEKGNRKTVFFHGTLNWYPNHNAVSKIITNIAPKLPETQFIIAGKNLQYNFLQILKTSKNIEYVGYVEDLQRYIKTADICIAPITSGGGTKLKVLEYAASEKPLVATYKAVEGLEFRHGYDCLLSQKVNEEFIENIINLLNNERLANRLAKNAKKLAAKYSWSLIAEQLNIIYHKMIKD